MTRANVKTGNIWKEECREKVPSEEEEIAWTMQPSVYVILQKKTWAIVGIELQLLTEVQNCCSR